LTADRMLDFSAAQADRFHLSAIDANTGTAANEAFSFIANTAFSGAAQEMRNKAPTNAGTPRFMLISPFVRKRSNRPCRIPGAAVRSGSRSSARVARL